MSDPMHDRCPALKPGTGDRCALYVGHDSDHALTRTDTWRAPWRFDVPEVPDSVTAFQDGDEGVWVRRADNPQLWSRWLGAEMMALVHAHREVSDSASAAVCEVIALGGLPLVECEDPRAAS